MSPEQARGQTADKRSDIWAFGCVVYEMLTGHRAFEGVHVNDVLGAAVSLEPNWQVLPLNVPPAVRTLLRSTLIKDRRQRVADISTARFVLENVASLAPLASALSTVRQPGARWRRIAMLSASAAMTGILGGAVVWVATRPAPPRVTRFRLSPAGDGRLSIAPVQRDLTVAPDGRRIVYVGMRAQGSALFVRAVDQLEPTLLVGNGVPRAPFPSPDGQWIGFIDIAGGTPVLKKVAATGGSAQTLCAIDGLGYGATWGDDGSIIFATVRRWAPAGSSGAGPRWSSTPDHAQSEGDHLWPQYLPGHQAVLFTITSNTSGMDASKVAVLVLRTRIWKVLVPGGSQV
jgi:serine/threonine-protein kinase